MNEETGEVELREGKSLDYADQARLIELLDTFMDFKSVNAIRHQYGPVDDIAIEIEDLLTEAGWYA